jgi:hypothetical protein
VFRTDSGQESAQGSSSYFLDSADSINFFLERDAVDASGHLKDGIRKAEAVNKVRPIFFNMGLFKLCGHTSDASVSL